MKLESQNFRAAQWDLLLQLVFYTREKKKAMAG